MSQQNIEIVKRQIEGLNRGDWEGSIEGVDPAIEWVVAREHPGSRTISGVDDLRAYRQDWAQSLGGLTFEPERIVGRDDLVVAVGRIRGTGMESGAAVGVPIAFVSRFRGDSVVRVEEYLDPQEALEVAGLSNPSD
jgi:ketosteroid isomerase-like protein